MSMPLVDGYSYRGHVFRWEDCSERDKPKWFAAAIDVQGAPSLSRWLNWDSKSDWQPRHFEATVDAGGVDAVRNIVFQASGWASTLKPEHIDRYVIPLLDGSPIPICVMGEAA